MNVNNALFQISDCWFLDSYIDSVLYTGRKMGEFRKQHMGTDLLTAFHGVLRFPLIRHVGAFSSFVVESIAGGNKRILDAYMALAGEPLYAANICFSEFGKRGQRHEKAVAMLLDSGGEAINRHLQLR